MVYILENNKFKLSKEHHPNASIPGRYVCIFETTEASEACLN